METQSERQSPTLTREQVLKAETGRASHPALAVLERNMPVITQANAKLPGSAGQYGSFADELLEIGPYTLGPTDLIGIWSRMSKVKELDEDQRINLGRAITNAYIVQGVENPVWKEIPRLLFENTGLSPQVSADKSGLAHVRERLGHVEKSYKDIESYVYGSEGAGAELDQLYSHLTQPGASERISAFGAIRRSRTTPILEEVLGDMQLALSPLRAVFGKESIEAGD